MLIMACLIYVKLANLFPFEKREILYIIWNRCTNNLVIDEEL
jgi:hypothetical protein